MTNTKATVPSAQAKKITCPFARVPLEKHPCWFDRTVYAQLLGTSLYVEAVGNGSKPPGIPVGADWRETLCRILRIDGPSRPMMKKALSELERAGLLQVRDGWVRVLYTVAEVEAGQSLAPAPELIPVNFVSPSQARPKPLQSPFDLKPQNDSTHTSTDQIREDRSEERETRAREGYTPVERVETPIETPLPPPPVATPPSVDRNMWLGEPDATNPRLIGHDFLCAVGLWSPGVRPDLVEYIGLRPDSERRAALEVLQRERATSAWFKANGSARHVVEWWDRAYGKGRTPNQRDDRPGVRSTRSAGVDADKPQNDAAIQRLTAELAANRMQRAALPRDCWDRTKLENEEAELLSRIARLASKAA